MAGCDRITTTNASLIIKPTNTPKTMENTNNPNQAIVEEIYNYAAQQLFENNMSQHDVINLLMDRGLSYSDAKIVTSNLIEQGAKEMKSARKKGMIFGLLWFFGGLAVTIFTYNAASEGGTYIVAWGAMLWGIIQFFRSI